MGVFDEKGRLLPARVLGCQQVPTCCVPLYSLATSQGIATSLNRVANLGSVRPSIRTLLRFQRVVVRWWFVGGCGALCRVGHVRRLPPDGF